jgi:hypothetical protein
MSSENAMFQPNQLDNNHPSRPFQNRLRQTLRPTIHNRRQSRHPKTQTAMMNSHLNP